MLRLIFWLISQGVPLFMTSFTICWFNGLLAKLRSCLVVIHHFSLFLLSTRANINEFIVKLSSCLVVIPVIPHYEPWTITLLTHIGWSQCSPPNEYQQSTHRTTKPSTMSKWPRNSNLIIWFSTTKQPHLITTKQHKSTDNSDKKLPVFLSLSLQMIDFCSATSCSWVITDLPGSPGSPGSSAAHWSTGATGVGAQVAIGFSIMAYRLQGLRRDDLLQLITALQVRGPGKERLCERTRFNLIGPWKMCVLVLLWIIMCLDE